MPDLNPNRRLEVDSELRCDKHGAIYKLFRRQHQQVDGTLLPSYENQLWPVRPEIPPPLHHERMTCPTCGAELKRVAP